MVHIFYYRSLGRLPLKSFEFYLQQLPLALQNKILAFRQWQDAERSLAGNILLLKGMQMTEIKGYSLLQLKYNDFQKPFFDDQLHFNISHSGQYTVCAISKTHQVGIDVEELNEIPLVDFTEFFNEGEWAGVLNAPNKLHAFYTLWTKKEAFLKVIGSGLNVPLNKVIIQNNIIQWKVRHWVLQEIKLEPSYLCYLCTNHPLPMVQITGINL